MIRRGQRKQADTDREKTQWAKKGNRKTGRTVEKHVYTLPEVFLS